MCAYGAGGGNQRMLSGRAYGQSEKEDMERDLSEKLSMQLLWLQNNHVEIQVSPLRVTLKVSGTGSFLPVSGLETQQTIYRIQPCETIRRSRWMRD